MDLKQSLDSLQSLLRGDLVYFVPELILCATILVMLFLRLFKILDRVHMGSLAVAGIVVAFIAALRQWSPMDASSSTGWPTRDTAFGGMLAYDSLAVFARIFLIGCTGLVIWLSLLTGIPDREDSTDFYTLLLGATVGMCVMASANHLLMVFIGIEMASLPSYAMAGFMKGRRQSSEAALKYVVYGSGASGIMLFGISWLVGKFGTGYLPDITHALRLALQEMHRSGGTVEPIVLGGIIFTLVGIAFKVSAVPFHFWCPDVFEGAPAEVAGFLSVASKGAALVLLGRIGLDLAGLDAVHPDTDAWLKVATYLGPAIGFFAALSATFGNLAAYRQTNIKRLLAYSTIAHAGYMLMGVATFLAEGVGAVLFYLVAYLVMNLGAFAVIAFIRNKTGSEELSTYRGLIQRSPIMAVTLGLFICSLLGLPPLVGFAAKFQIFRVLFDAGQIYATKSQMLSNTMFALLIIGGINTVISLIYYVRVLKIMVIDSPVQDSETPGPISWSFPVGSVVYATVLALAVFVLGILWDPLAVYTAQGMQRFTEAEKPARSAPAAKRALVDSGKAIK
ncbi:MAG TPA: NADH-quinone oxidoreductase subunit N [Gemmataceae bacterium]|nr:NADH-quinone oxidoreductase subunit N [Gemmataceae bacterium]